MAATKPKRKLTDKERKKKKKEDLIQNAIVYIVLGIWIGAAVGKASVMADGDFFGSIDGLSQNFMQYLLPPFPTNAVFVLIGVLIAGVMVAVNYEKYLRLKDVVTNPNGDAEFEDDYQGYDNNFVIDPSIVERVTGKKPETYYTDDHKKIVVKPAVTNARDAKGQYKDPVYRACWHETQLYADKVAMSLNGGWCQRNTNTMIFGGSGAGKSRFFLMPNLLQANSNYIVTDPSGEIMKGYGAFLEKEEGYIVKCLNISQMTKSCRFNPLHYIRSAEDIPVIVTTLMENTQKTQKAGGDDFWQKTTQALLCCIVGYLFEVEPPERRNFYNVLEILRMATAAEGDEDAVTDFDNLMNELGQANPNSYAYNQYRTYHLAPRKTANNILISTAVLVSTYIDIMEFNNLTYKDEMELDKFGAAPYKLKSDSALYPEDVEYYEQRYESGKLLKGYIDVEDFEKYKDQIERDKLGRYIEGKPYKMAIFLAIPTADTTYNWLTAMLYSMVFKLVYKRGEKRAAEQVMTNPKLAYPARFLIDECANIGKIPNLQEYLATCRKYMISIVPIFQSFSQVQKVYGKEDANSIYANCDTTVFLGGVDAETIKMVTDRLGKESIQALSTGTSGNAKSKSASQNIQNLGRELMSRTQVEQLDNSMCIVFVRAVKPFKVKKFNLNAHPNYKYTQEADPEGHSYNNPFDITFEDAEIEAVRVKKQGEDGYTPPKKVKSARLQAQEASMKEARLDLAHSLAPVASKYAVLQPGADREMQNGHEQYIAALTNCGREAIKYNDEECMRIIYNIISDYKLSGLGLSFPASITKANTRDRGNTQNAISDTNLRTEVGLEQDRRIAEKYANKITTPDEMEEVDPDNCTYGEHYHPTDEFGHPTPEEAESRLGMIFSRYQDEQKEKTVEKMIDEDDGIVREPEDIIELQKEIEISAAGEDDFKQEDYSTDDEYDVPEINIEEIQGEDTGVDLFDDDDKDKVN